MAHYSATIEQEGTYLLKQADYVRRPVFQLVPRTAFASLTDEIEFRRLVASHTAVRFKTLDG